MKDEKESEDGSEIPMTVGVRLDRVTRVEISEYMKQNNLTRSQALRTLISLGLRSGSSSSDSLYRESMTREGINLGKQLFATKVLYQVHLLTQELIEQIKQETSKS